MGAVVRYRPDVYRLLALHVPGHPGLTNAIAVQMQVVNLITNQVSRVIGQVESGERFLWIALYQGDPRKLRPGKLPGAASESSQKQAERDPILLAAAHNRQRFYIFSRREPPDAEEAVAGRHASKPMQS